MRADQNVGATEFVAMEFVEESEILQRSRDTGWENALELFCADDRRYKAKKHHHAWESLAQRALRQSRALTLVALCEAMLDANMSEEQVAAILLAAKI